MPPNPIPMPWFLQRWTIAATRRHGSSSARRSTLRRDTSFSTRTMNRARAANSSPIAGPRWFFTGTIATARCAPKARSALADAVAGAARRFGIAYAGPGTPEPDHVTVDVPRPPHWGGFRLYPEAVELWVEGEFRIHDRARWTRTLSDRPAADAGASWSVTRLQP
jgi:hypothetical protein